MTKSGKRSVWDNWFQIATEQGSAIDVKASQKWVFLTFRLKWMQSHCEVDPDEESSAAHTIAKPLCFGIGSYLPASSYLPSLTEYSFKTQAKAHVRKVARPSICPF